MNVHAVEVERAAQRPLMSGFHAHFSLGGFAGAGLMTFLLSMHLGAHAATLICVVPMLAGTVLAWPRLLRTTRAGDGPLFVLPRGVVLLLALLAGSMFLAEGALLDWSALLITSTGLVAVTQGGLGYLLFSIAMTVGRLGGDTVVARVGDRATLVWGGLLAVAGFVLLLLAPVAALAMAGFLLIGLGASNLVPVLFRRTGTQSVMPVGMAVAAITFTGYAGHLLGPAGIGFIAKAWGLKPAFWMLASFPALVALSARFVSVERAG
jgi:predicted MFS family arabinose efflux permease